MSQFDLHHSEEHTRKCGVKSNASTKADAQPNGGHFHRPTDYETEHVETSRSQCYAHSDFMGAWVTEYAMTAKIRLLPR